MGSVFGVISEETPPYTVLSAFPDFEVRKYAAGTAIEASDTENKAFMSLAGYIGVMRAPENDQGRKVAMTAPVVSLPDTGRMQFILPAALNDGAPTPSRPGAVAVVPRAAAVYAVETFSGSWNEANARKRAGALADRARGAGYDIPEDLGAWEWRRFNPPWTLGWMKKNEVCVPVEGAPAHT